MAQKELTLILRLRDQASKALGSLGANVVSMNKTMTLAGAGLAAMTGAMAGLAREGAADVAAMVAVRVAVENAGGSWGQAEGQISTYLDKMRDTAAIADDQMKPALASLIATTGDYRKSMQLASLAADLARGKNIDLATAATLVGKVAMGNTSALTRYGIVLREGATAQEALAELQRRFAGQAVAYGNTQQGQLQALSHRIADFRENIGTAVTGITPFVALLPGLSAGYTLAGGAVGVLTSSLGANTIAMGLHRVAALASATATGVWTAAQWALNFAMSANPLVAAIAGLAALAAGVIWAYQNVEAFRKAVDAQFEALRLLGSVAKGVGDILGWLGGQMRDVAGAIGARLFPATAAATAGADDAYRALQAESVGLRGVSRDAARAAAEVQRVTDANRQAALAIVNNLSGQEALAYATEDVSAQLRAENRAMRGLTEGSRYVGSGIEFLRAQMLQLKQANEVYGEGSEQSRAIIAKMAPAVRELTKLFPGLKGEQQAQAAAAIAGFRSQEETLTRMATTAEKELAKEQNAIEKLKPSIAQVTSALIAMHPATARAAAQVTYWNRRIADVNLALIANQDQMKAAQAELSRMSERLSELNKQLGEQQRRLSELSKPQLAGMGDMGKQINAIQDALKRMNLAELMGKPFAEILAQYPLLTEGAMQYLGTLPQTREGLEAALKQLQALEDVQFDEKLRLIAEAAGESRNELSFDQALTSIAATKNAIASLTGQISSQEAAIRNQQNAIQGMQFAADALNRTLVEFQLQLRQAEANQQLVTQALQLAFTWLIQDREKMMEMGAEGVAQSAIVDEATRALLTAIDLYASGVKDSVSGNLEGVVRAYEDALRRAQIIVSQMPAIPSLSVPVSVGEMPFAGSFAGGGVVPGPVGAPAWAIVHGGEPIGRAAGGVSVYITVQGSVTAERDLAETIRRELLLVKSRNVNTGL